MGTMKAWVWYKNRTNKISGKTLLIFLYKHGDEKERGMKKEVKNHGLKGPRCMGTCPSNFFF